MSRWGATAKNKVLEAAYLSLLVVALPFILIISIITVLILFTTVMITTFEAARYAIYVMIYGKGPKKGLIIQNSNIRDEEGT